MDCTMVGLQAEEWTEFMDEVVNDSEAAIGEKRSDFK